MFQDLGLQDSSRERVFLVCLIIRLGKVVCDKANAYLEIIVVIIRVVLILIVIIFNYAYDMFFLAINAF